MDTQFDEYVTTPKGYRIKFMTPDGIWYEDGGTTSGDNTDLRSLLAQTLTTVPATIVQDVYRHCTFIMVMPEEKGTYFHKDEWFVKDRHLIVLPHTLLECSWQEQQFTLLHEIAHYRLKHRVAIHMTTEEYDSQEKAADALANKWLALRPLNTPIATHKPIRIGT